MQKVIQQLNPRASARQARVCIFDFDGTVSLIRSGWMEVMVPMMIEVLQDTKTAETPEELRRVVEEFVWRLTGKQTIYQMIELAAQVEKRGGNPEDPLVYKRMYLDRLHARIRHRLDELRAGEAADKYLVPGAREFITALREHGLSLYLASGTDQEYMREEARLLGMEPLFDGGVYGALDNYKSFSKRILIQQLIAGAGVRGDEFLGFGDGYVEIENVKEVGGVAVGLATAEPECQVVDEWKRSRLASVGADFIIPNFLCRDELLHRLFCNGQ
jgi:phosphoglycolate phosphatase-like HAD superfamily hydrolase